MNKQILLLIFLIKLSIQQILQHTCVEMVGSCTDQNCYNSICLQCDQQDLDIYNLCQCQTGQYFDNDTQNCLNCHENCKNCNGELENNCLQCEEKEGWGLNTFKNECQCNKGYIKTGDMNSPCQKCYFYGNKCVLQCPDGMVKNEQYAICELEKDEFIFAEKDTVYIIVGVLIITLILLLFVYLYHYYSKLFINIFKQQVDQQLPLAQEEQEYFDFIIEQERRRREEEEAQEKRRRRQERMEKQMRNEIKLNKMRDKRIILLREKEKMDNFNNDCIQKAEEFAKKANTNILQIKEFNDQISKLEKSIEEQQFWLKQQYKNLGNQHNGIDFNELTQKINGILQKDIIFIQNLKTPPERIEFCLRALHTVLTNTTEKVTWDQIKGIVQNVDFRQKITSYNIDVLSEKVYNKLKDYYISNDLWDIDKFYQASEAAGVFSEWVNTLVQLNEIKVTNINLYNKLVEIYRTELQVQKDYDQKNYYLQQVDKFQKRQERDKNQLEKYEKQSNEYIKKSTLNMEELKSVNEQLEDLYTPKVSLETIDESDGSDTEQQLKLEIQKQKEEQEQKEESEIDKKLKIFKIIEENKKRIQENANLQNQNQNQEQDKNLQSQKSLQKFDQSLQHQNSQQSTGFQTKRLSKRRLTNQQSLISPLKRKSTQK